MCDIAAHGPSFGACVVCVAQPQARFRARAKTVAGLLFCNAALLPICAQAKLLVFTTSASHSDQLASCLDPAAVAREHNFLATRVKAPKQNGQRSELSLALIYKLGLTGLLK